jgi:hypothetical protein
VVLLILVVFGTVKLSSTPSKYIPSEGGWANEFAETNKKMSKNLFILYLLRASMQKLYFS